MKKKLLFIINHYSPESDQHLFHVLNLVKEIAKRGVKVALVIERCYGEPPALGNNIEVYAQKQKNKLLRIIELFVIMNGLIKRGYNKIFVRISIHTAYVAIICSKIYHGETFFWHSGQGIELIDEVSKPQKKDLERGRRRLNRIGRHIDHFVTGPESMMSYYEKWYGIPHNKMTLLYNDVDIKRFEFINEVKKKSLRDELGLDNNKIYILFVHRFSPVRKSMYYIPYCMEKVDRDDVEYILIGSGPEEEQVKEQVQKSGIGNIVFLGSRPNNEIQKYYGACDIFFNPTYCEGFPRVIIEAMACGIPIVTTNAGGISDILDGYQKNYVVDINDRDLLADKLKSMIDSPEDRARCIESNLVRINKYSTENVAGMYINTIWGKK